MDVLFAIHDCALGLSPVTSLPGVKAEWLCQSQGGGRLGYVTVSPEGLVRKTVLGHDLAAGDTIQFLCPGGYMLGCRIPGDAGAYHLLLLCLESFCCNYVLTHCAAQNCELLAQCGLPTKPVAMFRDQVVLFPYLYVLLQRDAVVGR